MLVFSINVSLLNAQRHFYLNLSKQCLSAESALTKIQQEFEIDPNSHFKLINDTTDRLGMQHLTYKQYLYDFEIVGCMVLVHVKKGSVQSMNGIIMEQDLLPFERPSQTRSSLEILGEKVYIPIENAGKTTTKLAIKQLDNKSQSEIYLDASTGDTLRTISMRNFLDGNSNAKIDYVNYFPYKDNEEMEVLECKLVNNNYYSLQDTYRNFLHSPSGIYPSDLGLQDSTTFWISINIDSLKKSFNITEEVAWWYYSIKFTLSPLSNPDSILYSAYLDEPRVDYWWGEISFESEEAISLKKLRHLIPPKDFLLLTHGKYHLNIWRQAFIIHLKQMKVNLKTIYSLVCPELNVILLAKYFGECKSHTITSTNNLESEDMTTTIVELDPSTMNMAPTPIPG